MNNEEKILGILERMDARLNALEQGQAKTDAAISQMREEMNERFDAVDQRFDRLETEVKFAWQDLDRVEKRIKQHEKEYHEAV